MKKKDIIVLSTFSLFMVEAIMHYNMGKRDTIKHEEKKGFLPPTKSLVRLALIVGVFSVVNSFVISEMEKTT
jgi:hypothetical protein